MMARIRLVLFGLLSAALMTLSVVPSAAAWRDRVHASVRVEAGNWVTTTTAPSESEWLGIDCYPAGAPAAQSGECWLTDVSYSFHGTNYHVSFGLAGDPDVEPFPWEIRFDLSKMLPSGYADHTSGMADSYPMFSADVDSDGTVWVPGGTWWSPWKVTGFSTAYNMCLVGASDPFRVFTVRGANWNRMVGGGLTYAGGTIGFQVQTGFTAMPSSCG